MKRLLFAGLLALAVLAGYRQDASAWCRFNFGVGLGFNYEGGGNNLLWGLVKTAPYPGAPASAAPGCRLFNRGGCGLFGCNRTPGFMPYGYGSFPGAMGGPAAGAYPIAGGYPVADGHGPTLVAPTYPAPTYVPPAPTPTTRPSTAEPPKSAAPVAPSATQRVGYYPNGQTGYNYNPYGYYGYHYGYNYGFQAPSYWYGE